MSKLIDEIKELELLFSYNQYDGSGKEAFVIEEGSIPIMISAPHAINQFREGQIKVAEMYTGGIAQYLHKVTGCHLIYTCMFTETDPNYDEPGTNIYQDALKEYLTEHQVYLLIDLHGAAKKREFAVEMGTAPEQNPVPGVVYEKDPSLHEYKFIAKKIKEVMEKHFGICGVDRKEVWKNQIFDAGDHNTVTKYISENTSTSCIQLEINGLYRDPENITEFTALVNSLIELINYFASCNWNVAE